MLAITQALVALLLLSDCPKKWCTCGDGWVCGDETCDDGNDGDLCDGCLDGCVARTNTCGDGRVCTDDTCVPATGECVYTPVLDETPCGGARTCQVGLCVDAPPGALSAWPWEGGEPPTATAAAQYAGAYAFGDRVEDRVEVRDIRGKLLGSFDALALEAVTGATVAGDDAGPCALAFTASARQLFVAVCSPTADTGVVLAWNRDTRALRAFVTGIDLSAGPGTAGPGLAHHAGELFVGTGSGLVRRYRAERNDAFGVALGSVALEGPDSGTPVVGIAVDIAADAVFVASPSHVLRLTADASRLEPVASLPGLRAISYGRTFGTTGQGGLVALQDLGTERALTLMPTADLRGDEPVEPLPLHTIEDPVSDIAATACGRLLLASRSATVQAVPADERLDFEAWLRDELDQHVLYVKTILWPDGEPEGWVVDAQRRAGLHRLHPASTDAAGWAVQVLLLADALRADGEAPALVRVILERYAGLAADGIEPTVSVDGEYYHWYDAASGKPVWETARTSIFSTQKIVAAALRARLYYAEDPAIGAAAATILGRQRNKREYVRDFGYIAVGGRDLGPDPSGPLFGPFVEAYLHAEQSAALDPTCVGSYLDYWLDRTANGQQEYLVGQPVAEIWNPAFVYMYARMNMAAIRRDPLWQREFADRNAMFGAWTDDHGPDYYTVFSAGESPAGDYRADHLGDHPGTVAHFPALIGAGLHGDTVPVVGAYFAYRDGRRVELAGTDSRPQGAWMLVRYSNDGPAWLPASIGPPDSAFAAFALAELLSPGVLDEIVALETYRAPTVVALPDGQRALQLPLLGSRRVLASADGVTWDAFGFHAGSFVFDANAPYTQHVAEDAEGQLLAIPGAGFDGGLAGWAVFGDHVVSAIEDSGLVGPGALVEATVPGEGGLEVAVAVGADFDETRYVVRALGLEVPGSSPAAATLGVRWHHDGVLLSEVVGAPSTRSRASFELPVFRPAGATSMRVRLAVDTSGPASWTFDEVSVVRLGAPVPLPNPDFELGTLTGWGVDSSNQGSVELVAHSDLQPEGSHALALGMAAAAPADHWAIAWTDGDIGADPLGTRYLVEARIASSNLEGSAAGIKLEVLNPGYVELREEHGDSFEHADREATLYQALRKRDVAETRLRVILLLSRRDPARVTANERVVFDVVRVRRMPP